MNFKINEKVIYPSHGVAVVQDIIEKNVSGSSLKFYRLSFVYKEMTILVPVNNCEQTGVRSLSASQDIDLEMKEYAKEVSEHTYNESESTPSGWNKRQKDYQTRIQIGTFSHVLGIYKELMYIAQNKDLSFGEKTLLHSTEELLVQELMVTKGVDRGEALGSLRSPYKQFVVSYAPQQRSSNF